MGKGIVLVSGGLDSTLALKECYGEYNDVVVPLFIDYGQYAAEKERTAVYSTFRDISSKSLKSGRVLPVELKLEIQGPPINNHVGSVWNRTMALVGIASMWAYINGNDYEYIAVGSHQGDVGPDIKPGDYNYYLGAALRVGTKDQIALKLPIANLTNEDVGIKLGEAGISFNYMYSCYWDPPCGFKSASEHYRCPGCRRKVIAMKAAGIEDEILLDYPNGNYGDRTYQSPLAEPVNY